MKIRMKSILLPIVANVAIFTLSAQGFIFPSSNRRLALLKRRSGESEDIDLNLNVNGNVKVRPDHGGKWDDAFHPYAYQYATSGEPGRWEPALIVYAAKDDDHTDIKRAIQYAKENNLSLSIRSGGHQYLGFSSTNGRNIQVDMSNYDKHELIPDDEGRTKSITFDVGLKLKQITDICDEQKVFFPHGECTHVALGGHVQTGGYTAFGRSLGMMIDFVEWFEIITATGDPNEMVRKVSKPIANHTSEENDDLWFSVLGGSPGNLGVLTRVNIRVIHDQDVQSKGMFLLLDFTKECLQETLNIMAEFNDKDPCLPADYNYNVMAIAKGSLHKYDVDEKMRETYGKEYGVEDEDSVFGFHLGELEQQVMPAVVIVSAAYVGVEEKSMERADEWLAGIDERITPFKPSPFSMHNLLNKLFGIEDFTNLIPMSVLNKKMVWRWVREFDLPFEKRVYAGTSMDLVGQNFAEWATEKYWKMKTEGGKHGCHVAGQFIAYGGNAGNKVALNKVSNPTALGHRLTTTNSAAFDFFYEPDLEGSWEWGNKWLDSGKESVVKSGIGKEDAIFSEDDYRFLYAPWGDNEKDWGKKTNLDEMWRYYYDNEEVYTRLLKIKHHFDPDHVFTPNSFSVGYNDMMEKRNDEVWESKGEAGMKRKRDCEVINNVYKPLLENPSEFGA